jgi:mycothiol synthase
VDTTTPLAAALPADLTTRPLTDADAHAVWEVMAAQELHDIGTAEIEEADIVGDWQRPSFDIGTSTIGVFDPTEGDRLVGYAEVSAPDRGDAAVLPSHRGQGIGTWLAAWMQDNARSRGLVVVGMPVPEGSPGDLLLASLGYHVRWTSWILRLPPGATITERPLPDGYAVREATPEDYAAAHRVVDEAFLEWSVRDPEPYDDFAAGTYLRPGFEPWHLRVAVDAGGAVVGAAFMTVFHPEDGAPAEAYVSRLAVRRDQRGRGLAQSLMVDAFSRAREHGAAGSGLSTDSRTGALGLYEKVGMQVTSTWVNRAIDLR